MHGAAGGVTAGLGQRQCFHDHALPGKCRVAMHQHRQHLQTLGVGTAVHAGTHRAFYHRVDDFQVRRVEGQTQMHRSAGRRDVRAETLVVFDVAAGEIFGGGVVKLGKQVGRHFAQ